MKNTLLLLCAGAMLAACHSKNTDQANGNLADIDKTGDITHQLQNLRIQSQQPQSVGHGGTGLAHPGCRFLLGQAVVLHEGFVAQSLFHRV